MRNVSPLSCNFSDQSCNVSDQSCSVPDQSFNVSDQSFNVSYQSFNVSDQRCNVSDQSCNVSDQVVMFQAKVVCVSDQVVMFQTKVVMFQTKAVMFQTKVVVKITTHFVCKNFFSNSCLLWNNVEKNIVEYCRTGQITDENMAHAHCDAAYLRLQTHTLTICNTYCLSTTTVVAQCATVLRCTYIACIFVFVNHGRKYGNRIYCLCLQCSAILPLRAVFLNRRALASIIPVRERFSWNLSF